MRASTTDQPTRVNTRFTQTPIDAKRRNTQQQPQQFARTHAYTHTTYHSHHLSEHVVAKRVAQRFLQLRECQLGEP